MKRLYTVLLAAFLCAASNVGIARAMDKQVVKIDQPTTLGRFENLPDELIVQIFLILSHDQLLNKAQLVSKGFKQFVDFIFIDKHFLKLHARSIFNGLNNKIHIKSEENLYRKAFLSKKSDPLKRKRLLGLVDRNCDPSKLDKVAILENSAKDLAICKIFFPISSHVNSIITIDMADQIFNKSLLHSLTILLEENNKQSIFVLKYIAQFRHQLCPNMIYNAIIDAITAKRSNATKCLIENFDIDMNEPKKVIVHHSQDESWISTTYILAWAAYSENLDIVKYAIDNGAKVNMADDNGETALHEISESVSLNRNHNQTPEQFATQKENAKPVVIAIAKLLLKNGAIVNLEDDDGYTPLAHAQDRGACEELKELLLANGADKKELDILDEDSDQ